MWSNHSSFPEMLSDSETMSGPSSYSDTNMHMLKVNISKSNKLIESENRFYSDISFNRKPATSIGQSYLTRKNFDVNNVLEKVKKIDKKYSLKNKKEWSVTTSSNSDTGMLASVSVPDVMLNSNSTNRIEVGLQHSSKSRKVKSLTILNSGKDVNSGSETNLIDSRKSHSNGKSHIEYNKYKGASSMSNTKSESYRKPYDISDFIFKNHNLEFLDKVNETSSREKYSKAGNEFNKYESEYANQPFCEQNKGVDENISFLLKDRDGVSFSPIGNSKSIVNVDSERELKFNVMEKPWIATDKSSISISLDSQIGLHGNKFNFLHKDDQPSNGPVPVQSKHKIKVLESTFEIGQGLHGKKNSKLTGTGTSSDDSIQEKLSVKSNKSEDWSINSLNISEKEDVPSVRKKENYLSSVGRNNMLYVNEKTNELAAINLGSDSYGTHSQHSMDKTNKSGIRREIAKLSSPSKLSNSSISSLIESTESRHGLFTSGPLILNIEDLVAPDDKLKLEESASSDGRLVVKLLENTKSVNKVNSNVTHKEEFLKNDSWKETDSKIEENTLLDTEEEINEEIIEDVESDAISELSDASKSSFSSSSVKTNSSYGRMMDQHFSNSEIKLSRNESTSEEGAMMKRMSLVSKESANEVNDNESILENKLSVAVKSQSLHESVSVKLKTNELSSAPIQVSFPSELEFLSTPADISSEIGESIAEDRPTHYCNVGIQTDINKMDYYPTQFNSQHIKSSQQVMYSDNGLGNSFLQTRLPYFRVLSSSVEYQAVAPSFDLVFSEILRQQIELTKHFITSQQRMYRTYCNTVETLSAQYKPVTLKDTKECKEKSRASNNSWSNQRREPLPSVCRFTHFKSTLSAVVITVSGVVG